MPYCHDTWAAILSPNVACGSIARTMFSRQRQHGSKMHPMFSGTPKVQEYLNGGRGKKLLTCPRSSTGASNESQMACKAKSMKGSNAWNAAKPGPVVDGYALSNVQCIKWGFKIASGG